MQTHVQTPAEHSTQQQRPTQLLAEPSAAFADHRPQTAQLKTLQVMMGNSPQAKKMQTLQTQMAVNAVAQRAEDDEPLQAKLESDATQREATAEAPKPNNTGLPDNLKSGIESLSGMSMDHVKVHYNSDKPAQLNAHAYAQGSEIHVAAGQEQHLP
ncbi:MAG: DUF4157 domain-containing protein, partial [Pseudomonadota bacterium]|nr:DUF4157 domain-containing protein [Pseudomonadota bacterium]